MREHEMFVFLNMDFLFNMIISTCIHFSAKYVILFHFS